MTKTIIFSLLVGILGFVAGYSYRAQHAPPSVALEKSFKIPAIEVEKQMTPAKEYEDIKKLPGEAPESEAAKSEVTLHGVLSTSPYGESLRQDIESQFRRRYGPLLSRLNYTQEQSEAFIQLITDLAIDWVDRQNALNELPVAFDLEMEKRLSIWLRHENFRKQMWSRWHQQIAAHLQEDYAQFEDFEKTVRDRDQLRQLTRDLDDSLDDYTREQLVAILLEEGSFANVPEQQHFLFGDTEIQHHQERHEALTRRDQGFLERARDYLTAEQLDVLSQGVANAKRSRERAIELLQHPRFSRRF